MAIYHLTLKTITRGKGQSAVASAAYRRADRLFDERLNKHQDYTQKPDVIHSELIMPPTAPQWCQDLLALHETDKRAAAEALWNHVESSEIREDAQVAREIEFALPIELTQEQSIVLAREFLHDQFALRGMMVDWNIHWDIGNPHVHAMLSLREVTPEGFGNKVRTWNSKALAVEWRKQWAEYANFHLRLNQVDARIDHRSFKERGIDLIPTVHHGKAVTDMTQRGIATDIMQEALTVNGENLTRIAKTPAILIHKIASEHDSFTPEIIAQELGRYANDRQRFSTHPQNANVIAEGALKNVATLADDINAASVLTPEIIAQILKTIEHHESVFTERHLAKALAPFTTHADKFARALFEIKASPELIHLGAGDDGRDRFTTRRMFAIENDVQRLADQLQNTTHSKISPRKINTAIATFSAATQTELTSEQLAALKHIVKPAALSCLIGRAGTGKSFTLKAAKSVWESAGYHVQGVALSGIAADGLKKEGILSRTIESFRYGIESGSVKLNPRDVVLMDEAGMTDSVSMHFMLKAVAAAGAKLVVVGDDAQTQPVGPGAVFRALIERCGFGLLETVYRQKSPWQKDATVAFSNGNTQAALSLFDKQQCIHLAATPDAAMAQLVADWFVAKAQSQKEVKEIKGLHTTLIIAHRNDDVIKLNNAIRQERIARAEIADGYNVTAKNGAMHIAPGDRLVFLQNDRKLGVSNGRFATVTKVNFTEAGGVINFTATLDGNGKSVVINPKQYNHFAHGYAATVHKVQGVTVDNSFVYAGGTGWNKQLSYVAMTRHRDNCRLYADKTTHGTLEKLKKNLSRFGLKDSVTDFPLAFAERRGIDTAPVEKTVLLHLKERLTRLRNLVTERYQQWINPNRYAEKNQKAAQQHSDIQHLYQTREEARVVAAYVDANREMGVAWQTLQGKLALLGFNKLSYEAADFAVIATTAEYHQLQKTSHVRDELAATLLQTPERYQKAIAIYGLEIKKLSAQATAHACRQRVLQYQALVNNGNIIYRDKLAVTLLSDIKAHYAALKSLNIDTAVLRAHGIAHKKRQLFIRLSATERNTFVAVEKYQGLTKQIGAFLAQQKTLNPETLQKRDDFKTIESLTLQRDCLAQHILADRNQYDKALDFYHIGIAAPHFADKPTAEQIKQAETRWYKLQQHAAQAELRERITAYQMAYVKKDMAARLELAQQIVQDTKAHHPAVIASGADVKDLWRIIRADAKQQEKLQRYKQLDLIDRIGFSHVEAYVEAKRAHGIAWRELFATKNTASLDEKTLYQQLENYAARCTQERNHLADKILANPSLHQKGLDYFNVKLDELHKEAYTHQCHVTVENYTRAKTKLARSKMAAAIIADPKAHHRFILEKNLSWRTLYKDAAIFERQQFFAPLNPDEKNLHRLAARYKKANQIAGKLFSQQKPSSQNSNDKPKPRTSNARIDRAFAKRDYLAWGLVNAVHQGETESLAAELATYRVRPDKLIAQHKQHQTRLNAITQLQEAHLTVIHAVSEITKAQQQLTASQQTPLIEKALSSLTVAMQLQKLYRLDKKATSYQYALSQQKLAPDNLTQQLNSMAALKNHVTQLAKLNGMDNKKIVAKNTARLDSTLRHEKVSRTIDSKRLREDLNYNAEQVAQHYLGNPKHRAGNTWRYGNNKGSLVVTVNGSKQGYWRDFQTSEGGDMLSLIQHATGISDFKETLIEAMRFMGGESSYTQANTAQKVDVKGENKAAPEVDVATQKRIQKARELYQQSEAIAGTLAETYLRQHRGITANPLSDTTFRYHPRLKNWLTGDEYPALIVAARDSKNAVCGVQAIFLDPATAKKAPLGHNAKLSRGLTSEGALVNQGTTQGRVALAEGAETALSISEAHPDWTVYCTFGVSNFEKVALKTQQKEILICADNDGINSGTAKSVAKTAENLSLHGKDVWVAEPKRPETKDKWDFNDALLQSGTTQVKHDLANAKLIKAGISAEKLTSDIQQTLSQLSLTQTEIKPNDGASQPAKTKPLTLEEIAALPIPDLYKLSRESAGTRVEAYLRDELKHTGWLPRAVRHLEIDINGEKHDAMAAFAFNADKKPQAMQLTVFEKDSTQKESQSIYGDATNAMVPLSPVAEKGYLIAVDLETAITAHQYQSEVQAFAMLDKSNMRNFFMTAEPNKEINICKEKIEAEAVDIGVHYRQQGFDAYIRHEQGRRLDVDGSALVLAKVMRQSLEQHPSYPAIAELENLQARAEKADAIERATLQRRFGEKARKLAKDGELLEQLKTAAPDLAAEIVNSIKVRRGIRVT